MRKLQLFTLGLALISMVSVSAQKIEGKIFDLKTEAPIARGEVTFFDEDDYKLATVYSNVKGMYSFDISNLEGIHKITSSARDYNTAEVLISDIEKGLTANFGLLADNQESNVRYTISYAKGGGTTLKMPSTTTASPVNNSSNIGVSNAKKSSNGAGVSTSLPYFHYDFNSSYLTDANKQTLDQIVNFMKNSPDANVRVHVYLESRSNVKYNEWMTERRADRAIDYIVSQGISSSRLTKSVEKVYRNIDSRDGANRGNAEVRRCDFEVM